MTSAAASIKQVLDTLVDGTSPFAIAKRPQADPLKVLIVGAECYPYASAGGVGSVLAYLSKALVKNGVDARVFIPKFGFINEEKYGIKMLYEGLEVPTDFDQPTTLICNVKYCQTDAGVTVYFLENQEYYEKRANIYGYNDDPIRWCLLSRSALEFIRKKMFVPTVIHANDWHTGVLSNYLKTTYAQDPILSNLASIFTIHNLKYQGLFDHKNVSDLNYDDGHSKIEAFFSPRLLNQNFARRGIIYSDVVNTVSKQYAKEVLSPEYGEGLERLLMEVKEKFFGVMNGLDYSELNPKDDKLIEKTYDSSSLVARKVNKTALQREFDLPELPDIPLFGFVGRLDYQKGVDLIVETVTKILQEFDIQFIHVGGGNASLEGMLKKLKSDYPKNVGIYTYPNFTLPRLVFAGVDSILYPSRFEPCGVVQLEALRYGAPPIVRKVGGLSDTIEDFNSDTLQGTGFVFKTFDSHALYGQMVRVIELLKNKKVWQAVQLNGMKCDFSWESSSIQYVKLYHLATKLNKKTKEADLR